MKMRSSALPLLRWGPFLFLIVPVLALADPAAYCRWYAQTAVQQNQENLGARCGFTGRRWQSNYDAHYNWCVRGGGEGIMPKRENNARQDSLKKCRKSAQSGGDVADYCRRYAQTAVQQNQENLGARCGFTGRRWQSNYDAHYNWCVRGGGEGIMPKSENNARQDSLRRCQIDR